MFVCRELLFQLSSFHQWLHGSFSESHASCTTADLLHLFTLYGHNYSDRVPREKWLGRATYFGSQFIDLHHTVVGTHSGFRRQFYALGDYGMVCWHFGELWIREVEQKVGLSWNLQRKTPVTNLCPLCSVAAHPKDLQNPPTVPQLEKKCSVQWYSWGHVTSKLQYFIPTTVGWLSSHNEKYVQLNIRVSIFSTAPCCSEV